VSQQKASPQFVANREFRKALFGDHPYARTSETEASLQAIDRAAIDTSTKPLPAEQRVPADRRRRRSRRDVRAVEKAFGGWARGDVPKPVFAAPPPLTGAASSSCSARTASSRRSRSATSRSSAAIRAGSS
jgi:hypothetical protein